MLKFPRLCVSFNLKVQILTRNFFLSAITCNFFLQAQIFFTHTEILIYGCTNITCSDFLGYKVTKHKIFMTVIWALRLLPGHPNRNSHIWSLHIFKVIGETADTTSGENTSSERWCSFVLYLIKRKTTKTKLTRLLNFLTHSNGT